MSNGRRDRARRIAATALVVAPLLFAAAAGARADYEETEERLKLAGIGDDLRAKIHDAIARGTSFLLAHQSKDGAFRDPENRYGAPYVPAGYTSLCSLALAHAGLPAARAGAEHGLAFLVGDGDAREAIARDTYTAGLTAMLVAALHGDAAVARRIGRAAVSGLRDEHGWWGYKIGKLAAEGSQSDPENLSTTQFGALALWAGGRAGGDAYPSTWRRHLEALCTLQSADGSWDYSPSRTRQGYPVGSCMGFANLTLARAAIEDDLLDEPILAARAEVAARRARAALDRDAPAILGVDGASSRWNYYGLYALEKACVFADLAVVGGKQWYHVGAVKLIEAQRKDGGWGRKLSNPSMGLVVAGDDGDLGDTSFALLFLLLSSESYRPVTPRDVDLTPRAVTPGRELPSDKPDPSGEPPPPTQVSAEDADKALDRLDASLRDRDARRADVLHAIDDVERARKGRPDAPDAWLERSENLLVKTFHDAFPRSSSRRDDAVAVRTAQALAGARPRVALELRGIMGDSLRRHELPSPPRTVLGSAFTALARLGDAASFEWLLARVTAGTRRVEVRSSRAALGALATFDGVGGLERLHAVSRIVRDLAPMEAAAASGDAAEVDVLTAKLHWEVLRAPALLALEHLCASHDGAPATTPDGLPILAVADYAQWLAKHGDVGAAPWK